MKKRGVSSHLDWVIGFGLFTVSVVFLIVMLRPGLGSGYNSERLLDIVQDGLMKDVIWSLYKTPLKVDSHCESIGATPSSNKCTNFPFTNLNHGNTKIVEGDVERFYSISGSQLSIDISDSEIHYFNILNSEEINRDTGDTLSINCPHTDCYFGVPEKLEGISEDELDSLDIENYETIKSRWHYPDIKEFYMEINNVKIGTDEQPLNTPVYIRRISDFILKDTGELESVNILIKVW